ncbi:Permease of the drug/metabolite transporter (DMT) superfamily [Halobiforma haloterrestris]|uniref:Permease of the drug/metabolite transporter (DMT) superfamily n=1 Tax=Natronobacterium haloterrestre TaxID=148448 RepID=A0A1I1G351_NATHA|nr:DMT family transporter [Halobiforma haloterrestris]SFC06024.1 Permease of the drug/metabolite transporter (DMT) superfamily [Halobiforma haloterrestris]
MSGTRVGIGSDLEATPCVALAFAVFAASTSAILVRWSGAPSSVAAFYRVLFTTAMVAPVAVLRYRGEFARLSVPDFGFAVVAGVALAIHFAAWFESLNHTSVAASVTLVQTQPIFVAVGAALVLGERVSRETVVGIAVAIVGAAVMSLGDAGEAPISDATVYGNALALLGAITVAGYVLAGRSIRQRVSLFPYVTVVYTACAATLAVLVGVQGHDFVAYPAREWLLFFGMALGPGVFGHTVVNWVLKHLESVVVSVAWLGEPVGSTILALVLLAEVPDAITLVGGAVVLAGIYVTTIERERRKGVDPGGEGTSAGAETDAEPEPDPETDP